MIPARSHVRPWVVVGLFAAAWAGMYLGCQNSGGKVLGPSGVTKEDLTPRCGIPCESIGDCRKIKPKRFDDGTLAEFPFVWLECRNGLCVDVECIEDADCEEHLLPSYEERVGRACVKNQCAPSCSSTGECNDRYDITYRRMQCVEGVCLMGDETPDPECSGKDCVCFSDDECPSWTECRANNTCTGRLAYNSSRASGKPCSSDEQCGLQYMQQAMLEHGLNTELLKEWGICSQMCGATGLICGEGFVCVWVNSLVDLSKYPMELNEWNVNRTVRTTCLPLSCDACDNSLKECIDDNGCPDGEACVTTWGGCPGVCLDAKCEGCATWLDPQENRTCIPSEIDIPISVRRPD